ncbi:MAG: pilus assembly protein [Burkholderiaceae bacterium]|nr:pilus assembly protein [Burkholderiaceae bacterium]
MKANCKARLLIARGLSDESGTATVEFVLWLPVMVLLFGLIVDTSVIFGDRSQILRVVQDVNRAVSIGHVRTSTDAEDLIRADIHNIAPNAAVETSLSNGVITSTVSIPVSDLAVTNLIDIFTNFSVTVSAQHLSEN